MYHMCASRTLSSAQYLVLFITSLKATLMSTQVITYSAKSGQKRAFIVYCACSNKKMWNCFPMLSAKSKELVTQFFLEKVSDAKTLPPLLLIVYLVTMFNLLIRNSGISSCILYILLLCVQVQSFRSQLLWVPALSVKIIFWAEILPCLSK